MSETAIRARRTLTNKLIASHQAERLRPFFSPDACVVVGDGGVILGLDGVIQAFESQFRDPLFETYLRTPEAVELAEDGVRAAERGTWVGRWRGGQAMGGVYSAAWRAVHGQWVIERELYVTLKG